MRISDWSSDVCSSDLGWSSRSAGRSRRRVRLHCGLLGNPAPELRRGPGPQLTLEQLGVGIAGQRLIADQDLAGPLVGRQFLLAQPLRSDEHTSEIQSLLRISYAVFCLKNKKQKPT